MKKGIVSVAVLVIGFIALLSAYMMSSTYAKYTEEFAGASSTASIAKWDFTVGDLTSAENGVGKTFTFDLFDKSKIKVHNASEDLFSCLVKNPGEEGLSKCIAAGVGTDANTAVKEGFIAPGTAGKFDFKITNSSDVKFSIPKVDVTGVDGTDGQIYFCVDTDCAHGINGLTTLLNRDLAGPAIYGENERELVHTIWWYWEFESSDANNIADTKVGKNAKDKATTDDSVKVSLSITITLEQAKAN